MEIEAVLNEVEAHFDEAKRQMLLARESLAVLVGENNELAGKNNKWFYNLCNLIGYIDVFESKLNLKGIRK